MQTEGDGNEGWELQWCRLRLNGFLQELVREDGLAQLKSDLQKLSTEVRDGLDEIRAAVAEKTDAQDWGEDQAYMWAAKGRAGFGQRPPLLYSC